MNLLQRSRAAILVLALLSALGLAAHGNETNADSTTTSVTYANSPQGKTRAVVYYFHGNMRCSSCRKIEAYTKEAIQTGFADALKAGILEFKAVNVDEPVNEHYVQDFQLYTRSVVVERRVGDLRQEWKNLDKVWRLTRNKEDFINYVQKETLDMMKGT